MFLVTYIKKHNNTYTALKRSLAKPLSETFYDYRFNRTYKKL